MDEERKPWEQRIDEGEHDLWYGRFWVYLRLGTKRSVHAVYAKEAKKKQVKPSTNIGPEWYEAAKTWEWLARARVYDEWQRKEEDRIIAEEKEKVLRSGFALMHKRVKELDRITRRLIQMEKDDSKVWIPEIRVIGSGENAQTIENINFNAPLYTLIDKYLDSIAKETGERIKVTKSELSGKVDGDHTEKIMFYMPVVDDEDDAELKGGDANADNSDPQGGEDQAKH